MATPNAHAAQAMLAARARACTDITGFGLIGHALNIALASGVTLRFEAAAMPVFPGALELAADGVLSGGSRRGRDLLGDRVRFAGDPPAGLGDILFDAETSGGLLICIAADSAQALERGLRERDVPVHRVGEVIERDDYIAIDVRSAGSA